MSCGNFWPPKTTATPTPPTLADEIARLKAEVARLVSVCKSYAESSAAACREIAALRASRDEWMARSNAHAMESDRLRVEIINLKGDIFELVRDARNRSTDAAQKRAAGGANTGSPVPASGDEDARGDRSVPPSGTCCTFSR